MPKPLTQDQIIQILKDHKWNVDDPKDLIDLIRAVEKAHGIEPREGFHMEWVPDSEVWPPYDPEFLDESPSTTT
jgi:hypothetical protein